MKNYLIIILALFISGCSHTYGTVLFKDHEYNLVSSDFAEINVGASNLDLHSGIRMNNYFAQIGYSEMYNNPLLENDGKKFNLSVGYDQYSIGTEYVCAGPLCVGQNKTRLGFVTILPEFGVHYQGPLISYGFNLIMKYPLLYQCNHPNTILVNHTKGFLEETLMLYPNLVVDNLYTPINLLVSAPYENIETWQLAQNYKSRTSWLQRRSLRENFELARESVWDEYIYAKLLADYDLEQEINNLYNLDNSFNSFSHFLAVTHRLYERIQFKTYYDEDDNIARDIVFNYWDKDIIKNYSSFLNSDNFNLLIDDYVDHSRELFELSFNYMLENVILNQLHPRDNPNDYYNAYALNEMAKAFETIDIVSKVANTIAKAETSNQITKLSAYANNLHQNIYYLSATYYGYDYDYHELYNRFKFSQRYTDLTYPYFNQDLDLVKISNLIDFSQKYNFLPEAAQTLIDIRDDTVKETGCKYFYQNFLINQNVRWCNEDDTEDEDFEYEQKYRNYVASFQQYIQDITTDEIRKKCFPKKEKQKRTRINLVTPG